MLTAKFLNDCILILTISQMESLFQNVYHQQKDFAIGYWLHNT